MQHTHVFMLAIWTLCACNPTPSPRPMDEQKAMPDSPVVKRIDDKPIDSTEYLTEEEKLNYAWYSIVIADTGKQYAPLFDHLKSIGKKHPTSGQSHESLLQRTKKGDRPTGGR